MRQILPRLASRADEKAQHFQRLFSGTLLAKD
jgi:hypothetical protein